MSTETLKINLAQQILGISDEGLLEKVNDLLNRETIVGYEPDGTPVTKRQFIAEMEEIERQRQNGTLKTYSSTEVRKRILKNDNKMDR
ncbi:MAG TPA: hypothetical protein DDZ96_02620 [Porphyromonadaceae bacterium]|jgi:hypothetical protein|uniref:hypothetical protein n=1 Tax=Limibacterium fermenti TaxID=3229863 RepID=UPI000E8B8722|nr:hypothetical protein [Porphyromonadaceae bacterium]HBK31410.1 hypothetical protein [Porphyromonadaceae bacterium]HBL32700.1 hypothetical protein [Porphyromonadaceae bacterium]HBX21905.1 hypothetical protein [Porphyromonadaceae bacterium]HBX45843.1 hypothetical protein [Porphyromonadaceae bacterium]